MLNKSTQEQEREGGRRDSGILVFRKASFQPPVSRIPILTMWSPGQQQPHLQILQMQTLRPNPPKPPEGLPLCTPPEVAGRQWWQKQVQEVSPHLWWFHLLTICEPPWANPSTCFIRGSCGVLLALLPQEPSCLPGQGLPVKHFNSKAVGGLRKLPFLQGQERGNSRLL